MREEWCTVVLTMFRLMSREVRNVGVEAETAYGPDTPVVMVVQYLWGALQAHRVMDNFPITQF